MNNPRARQSQSKSQEVTETETKPVLLAEAGLTLELPSGPAYFNYYWLRDNCPSSFDPQTRERIFDVTRLTAAPYPAQVQQRDDTLNIIWRGEDHVSHFAIDWLDQWAIDGRAPDPATLPRRLWYADQLDSFVRVSQPTLDSDRATLARLARALIEDGIALVTDMEDSDAGLERLATALGPVTPTTDGYFFDVQFEIKPTNLAYTAHALEMHTDLPSEQLAPGVQFLHCRANSVDGGFSLILDGAAAAEAFRKENPADFDLLATYEIPFFRQQDEWDYRAHQRVIELDRDGSVSGLTISRHIYDVMDLPQNLLDRYYPAYCRFMRTLQDGRFITRFRLNAGECLVFDNHRIAHGREAFSAESGKRHLRGCYVDRGALRSTYRVLANKGYA